MSSMATPVEGTLLWQPSQTLIDNSTLRRYMQWLQQHNGLTFADYQALWQWSVDEPESFWASIWQFFDVRASQPYDRVLASKEMPGTQWFTGAKLNYAEHIFRSASSDRPAIIFRAEGRPVIQLTWAELAQQVTSVAATLRDMGVARGDRVVAYLPNIPQAVVAALACASIGAIWSSCSPDFGIPSVIDRFQQIEPKVLVAVDGYRYNGKAFDKRPDVAELQQALPTLQHTVLVPYLALDTQAPQLRNVTTWHAALQHQAELTFEQVPFGHPLWILYSSGTTGLPKPIVHGHGGILLEHLKVLALHHDLKPHDRFFWFTTTGWMMWNYLVSGLLLGTTILLYDGSPAYPDIGALWQFAGETGMTIFGTSASYILSCMKAGIEPGKRYDLQHLKSLGSTGSPLPPEGFGWAYEHIKADLWLASVSGGTDLCTAFIAGCPLLPVYAGELQCRCLGADVHAFDEHGRPVIDQLGELVITTPMPSMPIFFWNDLDYRRYHESYFEMFPGVWRHGDWIKIRPHGGAVIYGRSDSTIKRLGVRMGTSEFYRVVEQLPEIVDSLVVDLELADHRPYMPLFVVLKAGVELDEELKRKINTHIRTALSPRHVPDAIVAIDEVPRTLNGKKLEVPAKKILMGVPVEQAANLDSVSKPEALRFFAGLARQLNTSR